jgi:hypothetical protein
MGISEVALKPILIAYRPLPDLGARAAVDETMTEINVRIATPDA